MIVCLNDAHWGPQFIVPTISIRRYCGCVLLREKVDDELLKKELEKLEVNGYPAGYHNSWYIRKKGTLTWIKVGESSRREMDFSVRLDTTELGNGSYQVLGFMNVKVKTDTREVTISRQNIADLEIKN